MLILFFSLNDMGNSSRRPRRVLLPSAGSMTLEDTSWLWLANIGKKKISSGLWGNFLSTNQLSIVWSHEPARVLLPTLFIDLWAHRRQFPGAMSQNSNHVKLASSTPPWVCCVLMACTIIRVYSDRAPLEEGKKGTTTAGWSQTSEGCSTLKNPSMYAVTNEDAVLSLRQLIRLTTLSETTMLAL